jgi:hypothetical protein
MNTKEEILSALRDELNHWQELLDGLSEEQIVAPDLPGGWSIKDVVAHLMAWQLRSVARVEAALNGGEPQFPDWPEHLEPDDEDDLEEVNAWIYNTYRDQPWPTVYDNWRDNFNRFIELSEQVPEEDLHKVGQFPWMPNHPLSLTLTASYDHHHEEHLRPLRAWLQERNDGHAAP